MFERVRRAWGAFRAADDSSGRINSSEKLAAFLLSSNVAETGEAITLDKAMAIAAVYRSVSLISEGVAQLPFLVYRRLANGDRERIRDHWAAQLIRKPAPLLNGFTWLELTLVLCLLRGNAYYLKRRTLRGPGFDRLVPIDPARIAKVEVQPGAERILYSIRDENGGAVLQRDRTRIFHVAGLSSDGIHGRSVLTDARETMALSRATEQHGSRVFRNGAHIRGSWTTDTVLEKEHREVLEEALEKYTGAANAGKTPLLDAGLQFSPVSMNNEDAQFLGSRGFQVLDVARFFGVPPHQLFADIRQPRANMEQANQEFDRFTLAAWATRIESAFNDQLLDNDPDVFVEFQFNASMRTALKERYEAYATAKQNGWLNPNEIRQFENLNGIGPEGDEYKEQLNMAPLGTTPSEPPTRQ